MTARHPVDEAAAAIAAAAPGPEARVGLVLGSGLAAVADAVTPRAALDYAEIPGFPAVAVDGHAGRVVLGDLAGVPVAVLQGRVHGYEGDPAGMAVPIRTLRRLGCRQVVLTAAVGGLDPALANGTLVRVADHIALAGPSPLTGANDPATGPRFVAMAPAYDPALARTLDAAAVALGQALPAVVLAHMPGPQFETVAEARALRCLGADIVGMSMAPECVLARHAGLATAGLAVVVNGPPGGAEATADEGPHAQTLAVAAAAAPHLAALLTRALPGFPAAAS